MLASRHVAVSGALAAPTVLIMGQPWAYAPRDRTGSSSKRTGAPKTQEIASEADGKLEEEASSERRGRLSWFEVDAPKVLMPPMILMA
jgi:hypothetical protein